MQPAVDLEYIQKLEDIIKTFAQPLSLLKPDELLNMVYNLSFDETKSAHIFFLSEIKKGILIAIKEINKEGLQSTRANEVGNYIEPYLKNALNTLPNFKANTPVNSSGRRVSSGYPDIQLDFEGETCYIECKTNNINSVSTTQRSFYLSPSDNFKITKDALHFIVSFEVIEVERISDKNIYKITGWKILDASKLECDVKYEFNSDNRRMYDEKMILAEGKIK